jgi:SpoVK/Ycf46/Vps4 family AAA+-type ATPase
MNRPTPLSTLQKTYDDTHLVCSTAVYFESRSNEPEALRCWRNALDQLTYHKAYRLPVGWRPSNETEKELAGALLGLEGQARERIELLEALENSRKDAGIGNQGGGLGSGTVKPLGMEDLAVPPPLPNRPLPQRQVSNNSPLWTEGMSRSPSPEKKMLMKSTLRPCGKTRTSSSLSSAKLTRPPAASKAATQAWMSRDNPKVLLAPEPREQSSLDGSYVRLRDARARSISPPPSADSTAAFVNAPRAHGTEYDDTTLSSSRFKSASPRVLYSSSSEHIPRTRPRKSDPITRKIDQIPLSSPARPNTGSKMNITTARHRAPGPARQVKTPPFIDPTPRRTPKTMPSRDMATAVRRRPVHAIPTLPTETRFHDPFEDQHMSSPCPENFEKEEKEEEKREEKEDESEKEYWLETSNRILDNLPRGVDYHAAEQILNEVIIQGDEVHWEDIAGLDIAKEALKENVVYPFLRPDLFKGLREPAHGILLFGPPGTGKTMLARAVATESKSTFFAVSASSLISKFLGESEKLVRALFALAKMMAPSVIFVDEIDSLLSSRSDQGEHETSRRIKTEFLIQWSDLARAAAGRDAKAGDAGRVLVLAATNAPWAIDDAARRRFVRRQYIPLPEGQVRATQVRTLLAEQMHDLSHADIENLIERTQGTSLLLS